MIQSPLCQSGRLLRVSPAVILGSRSCRPHDHIFLSHDSESSHHYSVWSGKIHRCLPSPAQSFLVPSPDGLVTIFYCFITPVCFGFHWSYVISRWKKYKTLPPTVPTCVLSEPLPSDGHPQSAALPPLFWLFGAMSQYCFHSSLIIQTKWILPRKDFCSHVL
jgi:hypothetical protein